MTTDEPQRLTPEEIERSAREQASGRPSGGSHDDSNAKAEAQYRAAMRETAPYLTLGMQMALTIVLGAGIGWWIDRNTGRSFWLGMGAGIGAIAGMAYFIFVVVRMEGTQNKKP